MYIMVLHFLDTWRHEFFKTPEDIVQMRWFNPPTITLWCLSKTLILLPTHQLERQKAQLLPNLLYQHQWTGPFVKIGACYSIVSGHYVGADLCTVH